MYKSIEFLNNRRPDLEIRASFIQQLSRFEKRLHDSLKGCQTENWTELASVPNLENEELIITNTFLNSQIRPFVNDFHLVREKETLQPRIQWIDNGDNDKNKLVTNAHITDLCEKDNVNMIVSHRQNEILKDPILKHVIHIHPKDYNFIIKDGRHNRNIIYTEDLKLDDNSSDELNLKGHSFDKSSKSSQSSTII